MEARLNAVLLVALSAAIAWLRPAPDAPEPLRGDSTGSLRTAEDALARDPGNRAAAQRVAGAYLRADRPGSVLVALASVDDDVRRHPWVAHLLARAYERHGRLDDALFVAQANAARCQRVLGVEAAGGNATPVSPLPCDARWLPVLEAHVAALRTMRTWGVADPSRDPRAARAYLLAFRPARIASAGDARAPRRVRVRASR